MWSGETETARWRQLGAARHWDHPEAGHTAINGRFWLGLPGICLLLGSCGKLLARVYHDAMACLVAFGYPQVKVGCLPSSGRPRPASLACDDLIAPRVHAVLARAHEPVYDRQLRSREG
jgi:hypothetical protein